jgi:phosphoribosyl-AMP cyclohydrolase / phosphoribosyl-ATP pyrophosphohydrolase
MKDEGRNTMKIKLNEKGLVPAIAQDVNTGQVLMLGYMNSGSLKRTVEGGQVWFYSRSQEDLWHKGEVSSNYLNLREAWVDCDADTILLKVQPDGPTCHTGETSCFFTHMEQLPEGYQVTESGSGVLDELFAVIRDRQREQPEGSYTTKLFQEGVGRIAQKVIEEAGETSIAAVQGDQESLSAEVADLMYHALVLLAASGVKPSSVWEELQKRRK